jgi:hypothetical protein
MSVIRCVFSKKVVAVLLAASLVIFTYSLFNTKDRVSDELASQKLTFQIERCSVCGMIRANALRFIPFFLYLELLRILKHCAQKSTLLVAMWNLWRMIRLEEVALRSQPRDLKSPKLFGRMDGLAQN